MAGSQLDGMVAQVCVCAAALSALRKESRERYGRWRPKTDATILSWRTPLNASSDPWSSTTSLQRSISLANSGVVSRLEAPFGPGSLIRLWISPKGTTPRSVYPSCAFNSSKAAHVPESKGLPAPPSDLSSRNVSRRRYVGFNLIFILGIVLTSRGLGMVDVCKHATDYGDGL